MTGWTNLCLPYSKGFMNFACPDPSKRMFDFWNFLACSKFNQFCMNFSVLKMNMSNMEISQIQKKTYRWIPFFLLFFIPFFSIVNSLMVSNIVPDALVSITGKGSERFLGQLPQEKNIQGNHFSAISKHYDAVLGQRSWSACMFCVCVASVVRNSLRKSLPVFHLLYISIE